MPEAAIGALGVGASLFGANKQAKAIKDASQGAQMQPFDIMSAFGTGRIRPPGFRGGGGGDGSMADLIRRAQGGVAPGGISVEDAPGASLIPGFEQGAQGFMAQLQGLPTGALTGIDPNTAMALGLNAGSGVRQPLTQAGTGLALQGSELANTLAGFDSDAFAAEQFDRMNRLAAPGEETAAAQTANSLFSAGRLGSGDSVSGQVFRDLDLSQSMARDSRLLQSIGLAQQERGNIADTAGSLIQSGAQTAGLGEQISTSELQRLLGSIQAGTGVGGFQSGIQDSLLNRALASTGGISSALSPTNQQIQNLLAASGMATAGSGAAAAMQAQGANQRFNTLGQLGGSLLSNLKFGNWGSSNVREIDTSGFPSRVTGKING